MGDISREAPLSHTYDHTDASLTPRPQGVLGGLIQRAKQAIGLDSTPKEPVHITPGPGGTPQTYTDIVDNMAK